MSQAALLAPFEPPSSRRFWMAVGVSAAIHALLLLLHFQYPDVGNAMREKALDIILVNAKSARKPTHAQALAQANLDGGGNTDDNRRAKTPLPPTAEQTTGDDIQQMRRRAQELEDPGQEPAFGRVNPGGQRAADAVAECLGCRPARDGAGDGAS